MSKYTPAYYAAKSDKYKALLEESKLAFDIKLAKKMHKYKKWLVISKVWQYRGCIDRDIIPEDVDENECTAMIDEPFACYTNKIQMMKEVAKACAE